MKGLSNARRLLGICVLLVGCGCGSAALAASMTDFSETDDDIWFAFGACLTAGGLGFGLGWKLRITKDIINAGSL